MEGGEPEFQPHLPLANSGREALSWGERPFSPPPLPELASPPELESGGSAEIQARGRGIEPPDIFRRSATSVNHSNGGYVPCMF